MSKFKIKQIDSETLAVSVSNDAPVSLINDLVDILRRKSMVEDLSKSTVTKRVFCRDARSAGERLIEALEKMARNKPEGGTLNYKEMLREMRERKRRKASLGQPSTVQSSSDANVSQEKPVNVSQEGPANTTGDENLPDVFANRLKIKGSSWGQSERSEFEKSNYGPKGGNQYTEADNAERKKNNTGDVVEGIGQNRNVKAYSTKTGQLSAKQSADKQAREDRKRNKKQPVKVFTPEEIAAYQEAQKKKLAASIDINEDYGEILHKQESSAVNGLIALMERKSMLKNLQPTSEEMIMAGEKMGIGSSQGEVDATNSKWNNSINDWLVEASKPISSRFASKEQEQEYWNSIRVHNTSDDSLDQ
jgi:hypothetical protein